MVFCNDVGIAAIKNFINVTILILIDGFLQFIDVIFEDNIIKSHNPYFNRWFSAIEDIEEFDGVFHTSQSLF